MNEELKTAAANAEGDAQLNTTPCATACECGSASLPPENAQNQPLAEDNGIEAALSAEATAEEITTPMAEEITTPTDESAKADEKDEIVDIPMSAPTAEDVASKGSVGEKRRKKKKLSLLLFLAVNVIVIAITALFEFAGDNAEDSASLADIAQSISGHWYYLVCAGLCFLGIYFFQVLKVSSMIKVTTGKYRLRATVNSVILGKYYDNITPLAIGGQPFQAYYLSKRKVPIGTATAAPIVQLFLGTCGFITLALIAFIFFGHYCESAFIRVCAYVGLGLNCLTPLAIILFSVFPKLTSKIVSVFIKLLAKLRIVKNPELAVNKAIQTINDYRSSIKFMCRSKITMLLGYLLSILEKLSEMSITFFVMMACFNGQANYLHITALTLFIYAAASFVPTPGTAGASEGSFYIVFGSFWPMFIWRMFAYYSYLLFGFVVIIINYVRRSIKDKLTPHSKQ